VPSLLTLAGQVRGAISYRNHKRVGGLHQVIHREVSRDHVADLDLSARNQRNGKKNCIPRGITETVVVTSSNAVLLPVHDPLVM
jgi:hypothetical protein